MYIRTTFLFILLHFCASAWCNISEGPIPPVGQVTGGPFISSHCIITSELLKVDLRPLENLQEGVVSAQYNFINDTVNDSLSLIFVARNLAGKNFKIMLDGKAITGDTTTIILPPEHWLIPRGLPWSSSRYFRWSDSSLVYDSTGWANVQRYGDQRGNFNDYISFTIAVDSGEHQLEVVYSVQVPQSYSGTIISHCFTYILSPAKDWKEYSNLNLELYLPEDWELKSNLTLAPEGDHFLGYWKELPSDYFYIVTNKDDTNATLVEFAFLFGLWIICGLVLLWFLFRMCVRYVSETVSSRFFFTFPLWYALIGVCTLFLTFFSRVPWMNAWYGQQLDPGYGEGDSYIIIGTSFLWAWGVGAICIIQLIMTAIIRWRRKIKDVENP